jgi:hypothetical protein
MGYLICNFLLIAFLVGVVGKRNLRVGSLAGLMGTVASYLLFDVLLKTTLPKGFLSGIL